MTGLEKPYDGRLSRTVLWGAWGEIPLAYSATPYLLVIFGAVILPDENHKYRTEEKYRFVPENGGDLRQV